MTIITGYDTETTGLEYEKGHKIIEVCFSLYDLESRQHLGYYERRINPERSILADAQRVHGITAADLIGKPTMRELIPELSKLFRSSDIVVAHNGNGFDFPFTAWEFIQNGAKLPEFQPFDTADARWATHNGKIPKLQELCFALGVSYDTNQAHSAKYDTDVLMQCFFAGYDGGWFEIPGLPKETDV